MTQESLEKLVDSSIQVLFWTDKVGITSKHIARLAIGEKGVSVDDIHLTEDSHQQSEDEDEGSLEESEESKGSSNSEESQSHLDSSKEEASNISEPNPSDSDDIENNDKNRYEFFGECHIGFLKIIDEAIKQNEKTGDSIIHSSVTGKNINKGKDLKQR